MATIQNPENKKALSFIQGQGGCGKSFLMDRILLATRAANQTALVCATTALAASVYEGGVTAHSLFKLPVREDETDQERIHSQIKPNSERAELLNNTRVIIWDEFPNAHRELFETIYEDFQELAHTVFIGCGDFRQIPPVIEYAGRLETTHASIARSRWWPQFQVLELQQSVRDRDDPPYAQLVLQVGNGYSQTTLPANENGEVPIKLPLRYFIQGQKKEAVRFAYPEGNVSTHEPKHEYAAILATMNKIAAEWNKEVQKLNRMPSTTLYSADELAEADDRYHRLRFSTEYLNSLHHPSIPNHALDLKVGDICLLMRNLSQKAKLANNQRIRILEINRFTLRVQ